MTRRQACQTMGLAIASVVGVMGAWRLWWREAMRWREWDQLGHPHPSQGWYGPSSAGEVAWFWPSDPPKVRIYARRRSDQLVHEKHLTRYIFEVAWHPEWHETEVLREKFWVLTRGWERTWG